MYIARFSSLATVAGLSLAAGALGGCSSSSTTTSGTDGGGGGGGGGGDAGGGGGGAETVNGCTAADFAANDLSAAGASRTISFPTTAAPAQYTPACITIGAGQSVTWNGAFASHPLQQSGGDASMLITTTSTGTTATFAFPVGGTYGFDCQFHPSVMKGAIFVK